MLTQFESAGLVTRHHFEGGTAVFELNEGMHHDHIVCMDCGRVEEFSDEDIEERQRQIAARLGFEITDHSLTLHGHCVRENCPHRRRSARRRRRPAGVASAERACGCQHLARVLARARS